METIDSSKIVLALETAIAGGSISVFRNGTLLDSVSGKGDVSRSEDVLSVFTKLLARISVDLTEIDLIVASIGPGSFTGIRIGTATALGLKNALGIECMGISVLESIALSGNGEKIIAAVPIGKNDVCRQSFRRIVAGITPLDQPSAESRNSFFDFFNRQTNCEVLLHSNLFDVLSEPSKPSIRVLDVGTDLASLIGQAVISGHGSENLTPIYVQNARFKSFAG